MTRIQKQTLLYTLLTAIIFVGGYFFLRAAYHLAEPMPFTQEIVLVVLGTLATILITAILLNKQTEVELTKEQNIKFLELKSSIYMDLLHYLEGLFHQPQVTEDDVVRLQFLTHKLAISASPGVLQRFQQVLRIFAAAVRDHRFDHRERDDLHEALAELTIAIRRDLIGELDAESCISAQEIERRVRANNAATAETYDHYQNDYKTSK
ncbi:hypothetical protein MIN45_P0301 [Methylomarinovum tepidoasis]|uniref:Uncharacterized protein n=1 Tax=Methylomarinovum tepidoasis TaxID=2840183 RepID=A0AAU9C491_9GAMM|nr:hypothetical protein [Methylomarinovum sp. IN45]BCX87934.1 hypothetical protein MIN45_P0301 [Methylomarinovum sp. IN45]